MSENTVAARQEITTRPKVGGKKVIFAASFGNALEFFDFGIYNFFVIYISVLFFPPSSDPNLALLLAFATFGVSFIMRPLGGILIGAYADRCGRKSAMILTISLMSLGTAMIGFAPTYASAGYWGTITLVAARLIQGVAAGGEVGASMSILVESAPPGRRGFYSSWALATQGIASVIGGVTALGNQRLAAGAHGRSAGHGQLGVAHSFLHRRGAGAARLLAASRAGKRPAAGRAYP